MVDRILRVHIQSQRAFGPRWTLSYNTDDMMRGWTEDDGAGGDVAEPGLSRIYHSLNVLSSQAWSINSGVLEVRCHAQATGTRRMGSVSVCPGSRRMEKQCAAVEECSGRYEDWSRHMPRAVTPAESVAAALCQTQLRACGRSTQRPCNGAAALRPARGSFRWFMKGV